MADKYWWPSGGTGSSTGNWSSTTNWSTSSASYVSTTAPGTGDNANFGSYSGATAFTVTVDTGAVCANLVVNNANMTLAGSAAWSIYGGVTVTSFASRTYTGAITFAATTSVILNFGSMTLSSALTFNGLGGTWTLSSALTTTGTITLTNGTLDTSSTGNYSLSASGLALGAGTKALNLHASTVTLSGAAPINFGTNSSGFTFNAGTSQINLATNATPAFNGGVFTFYNVSFTSTTMYTVSIIGANTFNNLTLPNTLSTFVALTITGNQTINGTFTVNSGSLGYKPYQISSSAYGTPVTITANAVSLTNVSFMDITGAGAATWSGARIGNAGGNSGITFSSPQTWYWNATVGNWGSNSWATTPTGTPSSANFPLPQDTAIFTNNNPAAGTTVTLNSGYNFHLSSIDFSGRTNSLTFATGTNTPYAFGSITLSSAITLTGTGTITWGLRSGTATITSAGVTWTQPITMSGIGATLQFGDAFSSTNALTVTYGTLIATSYNVTCTSLTSSSGVTRSLNLGSGTWTITGSGIVWNLTTTGMTFNAGTSTVSMTSASAKTFSGGGLTYYNLNQGGAGALTVSGANTFNNITNSVQPTTVTFASSNTQTLTNFSLSGTAGNLVTINSSTAGTAANLVKSGSGIVSCDYLSIKDSAATPSTTTWYAGANSTNVSGNSGWIFTAAPVFIPVIIAELMAAVDLQSAIAPQGPSIVENAAASDSQSASSTASIAISEFGILADLQTEAMTATGSIAESVNASDLQSQVMSAPVALSELSNASDSISENAIDAVTVLESGIAQDSQSETMSASASIAESALTTDSQSGSMRATVSIIESASASDLFSGNATSYLTVIESAKATDAQSELMSALLAIVESGNASDAVIETLTAYLTQSETANPIDSFAQAMTASVIVGEAVKAFDAESAIAAIQPQINEHAQAVDVLDGKVNVIVVVVEYATTVEVYACAPIFFSSEKVWHLGPRPDFWCSCATERLDNWAMPPRMTFWRPNE